MKSEIDLYQNARKRYIEVRDELIVALVEKIPEYKGKATDEINGITDNFLKSMEKLHEIKNTFSIPNIDILQINGASLEMQHITKSIQKIKTGEWADRRKDMVNDMLQVCMGKMKFSVEEIYTSLENERMVITSKKSYAQEVIDRANNRQQELGYNLH